MNREDPMFEKCLNQVIAEFQKQGLSIDNIEAFKSSIESISLVGCQLRLNLYKGSIKECGKYFVGNRSGEK